MNGTSRITLRWPSLIAGALVLLALGAGLAYVAMRPGSAMTSRGESVRPPATGDRSAPDATSGSGTRADVSVTLTSDAIQRAGIVVASATSAGEAARVRLPGIVEPNAYKQVVVTPLVGGRITRVLVELGQTIRRGEAMAEIFSPEVAEAETRFVSARAELDAHERELQRTEKLVEIGAASRQELEMLHAAHTAKLTTLESARSRLELLGLSSASIAGLGPGKDLGAIATVPAPIAGVVTERLANAGLNVDTAAKLFTVVDLSTVWVIADVYEKDLSHVRTGTPAVVTAKALPDLALAGRVSYIDPRVDPATRTARVRIEVPNLRQELRLGMFADVSIETTGQGAATRIPRAAVQRVGDRTVVYVADTQQPGRFVEREVRLGASTADGVVVLSGVQPGDRIVTEGSFSLRAERDRLGLSAQVNSSAPGASPADGRSGEGRSVQEARVLVTEQGFEPPKLTLRTAMPVKITFLRTTDKTCATEVVFPSLKIRRALPLNQPVAIEFTPGASGEIGFVCGMNMLRGTVVVE
jgi:RND family efflux transporter MFP subunit